MCFQNKLPDSHTIRPHPGASSQYLRLQRPRQLQLLPSLAMVQRWLPQKMDGLIFYNILDGLIMFDALPP